MNGGAPILPPVNHNDAKVNGASEVSLLSRFSRLQAHCAMQYSKGQGHANWPETRNKKRFTITPRLLSALVLIACPAIILAGCSDSLTSAPSSPASFAASSKGYEHTLTPAQQKAAIAELEKEQAASQAGAQGDATASINTGK
jgi:cell division protein FtsB